MRKVERKEVEVVDGSMAEDWITPDIFVFKGRQYEIMPDGFTIKPLPKNGGKDKDA